MFAVLFGGWSWFEQLRVDRILSCCILYYIISSGVFFFSLKIVVWSGSHLGQWTEAIWTSFYFPDQEKFGWVVLGHLVALEEKFLKGHLVNDRQNIPMISWNFWLRIPKIGSDSYVHVSESSPTWRVVVKEKKKKKQQLMQWEIDHSGRII